MAENRMLTVDIFLKNWYVQETNEVSIVARKISLWNNLLLTNLSNKQNIQIFMYKGTNLKEIQQKYQEFMTDLFNEKIGISVEGLSNKERKTYMRLKKCYIDWVLHDKKIEFQYVLDQQ